ncbi:MAG TPA: hypothetical protein VK926_01900 [Gaiellaceae bacterium]|nr:hypothetical protein [Gaiellaceae bacterium]
MTFKTSFITAIVGAALVVVPAAWGQSQQPAVSTDAFERAVLASELSSRQGVQVYRDAFERTVAARKHESAVVSVYRDAFQRAVAAGPQSRPDFWNYDPRTGERIANSSPGVAQQDLGALYSGTASGLSSPIASTDAFTRSVGAETRSLQTGPYSDAFERAVAAGSPTGGLVSGDHHSRVELLGSTPPATVSTSTRVIEWPQVGIGFGAGILLALGLLMAMRVTRIRPLAPGPPPGAATACRFTSRSWRQCRSRIGRASGAAASTRSSARSPSSG